MLPKMLHRGLGRVIAERRQIAKNGLTPSQEMAMRILSRVAGLLVLSLALGPASGVAQNNKAANLERQLFEATNRERTAHGVPALRWNEALAAAARNHANRMAQQDALSHQFPGEPSLPSRVRQTGARFVWLSENVALGPNPSFIHTEFVQSPQHRANLLDADMNEIGIGLVARNGRWFAVEDFSKAK